MEPVSSTPIPADGADTPTTNHVAVKLAKLEAELMAAKDLIDGQNIKIAKLESQVDTVLGESIPDMIKLISAAEQVIFMKHHYNNTGVFYFLKN